MRVRARVRARVRGRVRGRARVRFGILDWDVFTGAKACHAFFP